MKCQNLLFRSQVEVAPTCGPRAAGEVGDGPSSLGAGWSDDLALALDKSYQFGISRYEITGVGPRVGLEQPLYKSGEIGEYLKLHFH